MKRPAELEEAHAEIWDRNARGEITIRQAKETYRRIEQDYYAKHPEVRDPPSVAPEGDESRFYRPTREAFSKRIRRSIAPAAPRRSPEQKATSSGPKRTLDATLAETADAIINGSHKWIGNFEKPDQAVVDGWYKKRVRDWKKANRSSGNITPPPGREEDREAAEEWFRCNGLRSLVRDARKRLAPKTWQESGPNGRKAAAFKKKILANP